MRVLNLAMVPPVGIGFDYRRQTTRRRLMAGPRRVIRAIINNGALARLTVGYLFFITKRNAAWIGVLVFAFHHGGATASGLVATVLVLPPVVLGPILSTVADRRSPTALLAGAYLAQALALGAIAVAIWLGVTPFLVYALALVEQAFSVAAPPGLYAGLPAIAHDAGELASANVAAGWAETAGLLGGSVVVSVLLSLHALGALFAVAGALMAIAAVLAQHVRIRALAAVTDLGDSDRLRSLAEGVRVVASRPRVRLMVSLIWAQYAVVGALDVLLVVVAIQQLGRGQGWVGYLNTTYGIGAVAVGLATASLVARRTGATVGCVAAATLAAFALMAFFPAAGLALLLVAVLGASRALLILIARARVQISTPPDALGRVFGVAEGLVYLGMAVGAALVPLLIHTVGIRGALLVVGAPAASGLPRRERDAAAFRRDTGDPCDRSRASAFAVALRRAARSGARRPRARLAKGRCPAWHHHRPAR